MAPQTQSAPQLPGGGLASYRSSCGFSCTTRARLCVLHVRAAACLRAVASPLSPAPSPILPPPPQFRVKMVTATDDQTTDIIVEGDKEEIERFWKVQEKACGKREGREREGRGRPHGCW